MAPALHIAFLVIVLTQEVNALLTHNWHHHGRDRLLWGV